LYDSPPHSTFQGDGLCSSRNRGNIKRKLSRALKGDNAGEDLANRIGPEGLVLSVMKMLSNMEDEIPLGGRHAEQPKKGPSRS